MARPKKEGLDYFPLDVDIDQDDKVALIEAKHGLVGFGIIIKLLMKIYKNNYFYPWTEREQLLFSKRVNVDINSINAVVNDSILWGLFDKGLYENHYILTSKGIQRRYIEAIVRRKEVEFIKEYLLIDPSDYLGNSKINVFIVNADNNRINVDINSINENINPQSKVKESKEKKSNNNSSSRKSKTYEEESLYYQLSIFFYERIKENNPDHKEPNIQKWSDDIRKIIEIDKRTEEQVRYLMQWVQQDSFWKSNILSPDKLRKQFDQLVMKIKSDKAKHPKDRQKKMITTERPSHLPEPEISDEMNKQIEEALKDLPY